MPIDSLRDGFVRLCFDPSANVLGDKCRMVLEGQYYVPALGCTVVPNVLTKITSVRDIDCQFGAGSVLAESLKKSISCCGNDAVEIFALPRLDAAGAVKAAYTLTVTGTAIDDGRVDIYWGDASYNISVRITAGMTPAQIATAIAAGIHSDFPYVGVAAAGVITLTARNGGTVGNYLNPLVNWHGRNNYLPTGVTFAVAQTIVGSIDPAPLSYSAVFGECCVCCYAMLYGNAVWQDGALSYLDAEWACNKPQCFGHGYTYNAGSLGQILASDTNSATVSRLAHCNADPNFPWLKVAAYASKSCCLTVDNPEISIQGPNFGVLDCLGMPESCTSCFTFDEVQQLTESGFVTTVPVSGGQGALTSPMVVADITNNRFDAEGRENLTFQDTSARRLAASTATAIADQLQQFNGLGYYSNNTNIREGARGVNKKVILGTMRAYVKSQVGALFSEFENLDTDLTITDDFETAPKCQGIPGKLYMNLIYRPPVRIKQIVVNAAPKLLNNCA
jgi:phage tail sheath gpL-like